jgi:hypothetical protein
VTTSTDHLPDGLKPREQDPQAKVARQLEAMAIGLQATVNLVNRLERITKDAMGVSDDLLDWLMVNKTALVLIPGCIEALTGFSGRLLDIRLTERSAYDDILEVLRQQAPKMREG